MEPGRTSCIALLAAVFLAVAPPEERVVLESDGWQLVGDWRVPSATAPFPAVLLLHGAAGSRAEHAELADALARDGLASLRLDLRANGESTNLGAFREPYREHLHLNEGAYRDIEVALRWLAERPEVDPDRLGIVSASYSGEAVGEALRAGGRAVDAYVVLSPGSFSEASAAAVEASPGAWVFVRSEQEGPVSLPHIDEVFSILEARAPSAERRVLPGAGHATRLFEGRPELVAWVADWLRDHLAPASH